MPELEIEGGEWDVYRVLSIMYYPDPASEECRGLYADENHELRRRQYLDVTYAHYVLEGERETGQRFPIRDKKIHTLVDAPSYEELRRDTIKRARRGQHAGYVVLQNWNSEVLMQQPGASIKGAVTTLTNSWHRDQTTTTWTGRPLTPRTERSRMIGGTSAR